MVTLDATIVNVAIPVIKANLRFSTAGVEWVTAACALTFGGLLLCGGRTGDHRAATDLPIAQPARELVPAALTQCGEGQLLVVVDQQRSPSAFRSIAHSTSEANSCTSAIRSSRPASLLTTRRESTLVPSASITVQ
jgi:hypothetical protein